MDGPTGRRPVLAGAGLEVWEVIRAYKDCGEGFEKIKETLDWLSPWQLRDALHYWRLYPEEIEEELKARAAELYPHLFPRL